MKKLALIILLLITLTTTPAPCLSQSPTAAPIACTEPCLLSSNTAAYTSITSRLNRTTPLTAYAQTTVQWVRVVDDDVCLYATDDSAKIICLLEKSYYLSVLSEGDKMYLVAVMGEQTDFPQISGYVWKTAVEPCDKTPVAPLYPTVKLVVCDDSASVKLSPVPSAETLIVATNTQQVSYYGKIVSYNREWYYIYYAGRFGYVLADSVTQPQITLHPTPIKTEVEVIAPVLPSDSANTDEPSADTNTAVEGGSAMEIALIVFIVLLAAGLTLAVFLPGNVKKNNVFDQDI